MRDYGKIPASFWTRGAGKSCREHPRAVLIAAYLSTCQHSNMIGLYFVGLPTIAHETGGTLDETRVALAFIATVGEAFYDEAAELVYVPDGARDQTGETMNPRDNRHASVVREVKLIGNHAFVRQFWERYREPYQLGPSPFQAPPEPLPSPSGAPSKPLVQALPKGSGKPEAESEAGSETEDRSTSVSTAPTPKPAKVSPPKASTAPKGADDEKARESRHRTYATAYAQGIAKATGGEAGLLLHRDDKDSMIAALRAHAKDPEGKPLRQESGLLEWITASAFAFASTADPKFNPGWRPRAWLLWLNSKRMAPAARPNVQPATGGQSWITKTVGGGTP